MKIITAAVAALALLACSATPAATPSPGLQDVSGRLLAMHNAERARIGAAPLQWDPRLAAAAASYGSTLARIGRLQHSPGSLRRGQGENLWMGTRGAFSLEQMVGSWIAERAYFRSGVFPRVSRTGNWADVGHFTQVVWKGTTHVGCAIQTSSRWDFLICRYSPPGNIDGRRMP